MSDFQKILGDPQPGITLDQLAAELNALAKLRESARLAFCQRLAVAYLLLVGSRPKPSANSEKFYAWCGKSIASARGKAYTKSALRSYLAIGFSKNPEKALAKRNATAQSHAAHTVKLGAAIRTAARSETPPKPVSITKLRTEHKLPTDVATEVNRLMTAWEQASPTARAQFIYMVTGKRLAA